MIPVIQYILQKHTILTVVTYKRAPLGTFKGGKFSSIERMARILSEGRDILLRETGRMLGGIWRKESFN
jgi:hypothetical protein